MILCLICSITSVSAGDVNTTDNQVLSATPDIDTLSASVNTEQKNNTQSVSENNLLSAGNDDSGSNDLLGADEETGTFSDLDKLIVLSSGTLTLNQNYKYNPDTDSNYQSTGIVLSKSIIINGRGFSISGNGITSAFTVNADNVILENMNIINTYGRSAVYWDANNGKVDNLNFINTSYLGSTGGALYLYYSEGIIVNNTIFNNSQAKVSGALASAGSQVELYNSKFVQCKILGDDSYWGAAMSIDVQSSPALLVNCTFDQCDSSQARTATSAYPANSGILYAQRNSYTLINCTFRNNKVGYSASAYGMLAEMNMLNMTGCIFEENSGQGIVKADVLYMDSCIFENQINVTNFFNRQKPSYINIQNCNFTNSKFTNLFNLNNSVSSILNNILFENITVTNLIQTSVDFITISNSVFNNINVSSSAPIYLDSNYNTVSNCTFNNIRNATTNGAITINNIDSNKYQRILDNDYNTGLSLLNVTSGYEDFGFYDTLYVGPDESSHGSGLNDSDLCNLSYAFNHISNGGTIYITKGIYDLDLNQSLFFSIKSYGDGEVILNKGSFQANNICSIVVDGLIFNNTQSNFLMYSSSKMNNITFNNTKVANLINSYYSSPNSAFDMFYSNINILNGDFKNGYVIGTNEHANFYNITINDCINIDYVFSPRGYSNDGTYTLINITGSTFKKLFTRHTDQRNNNRFNNISLVGNTITGNELLERLDNLKINNWTMFNNEFKPSNVLFHINRNGYIKNIHIDDITGKIAIINNAKYSGEELNLQDSTFDNLDINYLITAGDEQISHLNNVSITNSTLIRLLDNDGGSSFNKLTVDEVNFTSGIILTLSNDMVLSDSNFTDFTGHVVVAGNDVVIRDTNFTRGNNSLLNGSAVYAQSGDFLTIDNCRFISNNASYGGAVYSNANPTAIMNSVFEDNRALANGTTSCGGAIYIGDVYNSIDDFTKSYLLDELNHNDLLLVNPNNTLFSVIYVVPYWQNYKNNESLSGDGSGKDINNPTNISDARIKAGPYCEIYFINNDNWTDNYYNMTNATINPDHVVEFVVRYSGMVFYGNNSIIDNLYFTVDATNTTFKDLTFTNNTGHSALVINSEDTVVDNCTFLNNGGETVSAGAAIQVLANNTSILNSTFTSNLAGNISGANGGAVFINASYISISDCHFSDNQAYTTGSHLFVVDDNELHDISLIDCNFTGGSVVGSGLGSGVYLSGDNLVVYNSNFTDNIGRQGAGLTVTGNTINLNITGNNFTDNRAIPQTIGDLANFVGGAVFFDSSRGPVSIVDNIFSGNNASVDGGALYINNMPGSGNTFAGNVFSDNHAFAGNGGAVYVNKVDYLLTVSGGEFTDNNATGNGGAIYINASVNINDASFNGNNATGNGGAIYNTNTLSLGNGLFNSNSAVNGGAIYNNGVLVDKGSRYIGNVATCDGGAIYSQSDLDYSTTRSIASFSGNRAVNGGAVYVNGTNNNIRGALFTNNFADFGSCIYAEDGSDLNVYDVEITSNHVTNGPQASGGHGDIYLGEIVNFAIPTDSLKLDLMRPDGSSDYTQYIYNNTMVRSDVLYVSESGTGLGLMSNDPTTLEKAFVAINDNGRIVFVESYMLNTTTINRNVTLAGYNNTISMKRNNTTAGENKYLFIHLKL